ncbi:type II secretion system F family protein [bacterium]|nr:type II secretion system F family protein [bacterium]
MATSKKDKKKIFLWEGNTPKGMKSGEIEAFTREDVEILLRSQGVSPTKIKAKPLEINLFPAKVQNKDLMVFTRQMATMLDAGLPLIQGLEMLSAQVENLTFKKILKEVKEDVEQGKNFPDALKKHPKVFDNLYVNMVAAGEIAGIMSNVMTRLAEYIEKAEALKHKIKGAMKYPMIVTIIAGLLMSGMLIYIIPTFKTIFASMNSALPAPTQFLVDLSDAFIEKKYIIFGIVFGVVFLFKKWKNSSSGSKAWDAFMIKAPLFGDLIKKVAVARFCRTMSTLLSAGVNLLEGLDVTSKSAGNYVIEMALQKVKKAVSEGRTLTQPLQETGVFPSLVTQMIGVGENAGALDVMMSKIADFYDEEVDAAVEGLTSMIEPIMMVMLGGMAGGMIVTMYLPVFSMGDAVAGGE